VTVVLDADVLIGALDAGDGHHTEVRAWFTGWQAEGTPRLVSVVNLSEVLVAPARDELRLRTAREALSVLGVSTHVPNEAIAVDAARLRGLHPISLPDAYALATARHLGARLRTFDRRLRRVADEEGVA
jgi:predicted nucleic acid-binding protein